jgi:predicted Fe-Mo cluster-binding NifX family protein
MNLCFPVLKDEGTEGQIFGHFGSAPSYLIYNPNTKESRLVPNTKHDNESGKCDPVSSIRNEQVEAVITIGIGANALIKLNQAGIKVFEASGEIINANIDGYASQSLLEYVSTHVCQGHSQSSGCGHHD